MSDSSELVIVISTVETAADAERLATTLVQQRLAACVQIDGPIQSHYQWLGKLVRASEHRLMIKSSASVWPALKAKLSEMHPYDEPEIIMVPISDASDGYRNWVIEFLS